MDGACNRLVCFSVSSLDDVYIYWGLLQLRTWFCIFTLHYHFHQVSLRFAVQFLSQRRLQLAITFILHIYTYVCCSRKQKQSLFLSPMNNSARKYVYFYPINYIVNERNRETSESYCTVCMNHSFIIIIALQVFSVQ